MFAQTARENVRKLVAAYGAKTGYTIPVTSKRIYGNRAFLAAFLSGDRSITIDKLEAMVATFRAKWPAGARWPALKPLPMDLPADK